MCWGYKEHALFWEVTADRRTEKAATGLISLILIAKFLGYKSGLNLKGLWPV